MSKSTKIIAGLGIVAGISVAALPAFTFATASTSDQVDLYAIVDPAIAMVIEGNNDGGTIYDGGADATAWGAAHGKAQGSNPASSVVDGYGVSPLVDNTLISSSATTISPNGIVNGNETNNFASLITVYTNNRTGYNLTVKANSSANMLGLNDNVNHYINPVATTGDDAGKIIAGSGLWGYKKGTYHAADNSDSENPVAAYWDGFSSDGTGYSAMDTSDSSALTTTNAPTSGGDQTKIYYGVSAAADQASDVYHVNLTYTATAN